MIASGKLAGACLLCDLGVHLCALPLFCVVETMRPMLVDALADMPPFVLGLTVIRGAPTVVIDGARLIGVGCGTRPTRFVTIKADERCVALAVDAVISVRHIPEGALEDLPPLLGEVSADFISAIGTLDSDLMLVLRGGRLVPDSIWAAIAAAGGRP